MYMTDYPCKHQNCTVEIAPNMLWPFGFSSSLALQISKDMIPLRTPKLQKLLVSSCLMALSGPVCVCVNPAITCRHKLIYIRTLTLEVKAEQGATAPFISPWPTKLLMFGEDMQSDQLHVPAFFWHSKGPSSEPQTQWFYFFTVATICIFAEKYYKGIYFRSNCLGWFACYRTQFLTDLFKDPFLSSVIPMVTPTRCHRANWGNPV